MPSLTRTMPRHLSRRALIAAALVTLASPALAQGRESWKTFVNDRFGTSIEYPTRFKPGEPPANNDGLRFTADDGATLAVWGSLNALEQDLKALEDSAREDGEKVTYRSAGKNWFVLSGTRGEEVFYKRYILSHRGEVVNAFTLTYPAALAATYDPIVARISKSLKAGRGYQTTGAP